MQKDIQLTVAGKVFKPNAQKVLALNRTLSEYFRLVKWYLRFNSVSKSYLHLSGYKEAKAIFNFNTALIQTAGDKAVEVLKSFKENKGEESVLRLERISIRFNKRRYSFSKTTNVLTPYWLTLSLSRGNRISLPLVFGEKQKARIEEPLGGEWSFATVEMVKRDRERYAHVVLKKTVELKKPETIMAVDRGEVNLAVAAAISKDEPKKPLKGQFWRGEEIKRIRGLYGHVRRKLGERKLLNEMKEVGEKEKGKVNQQLHIIASQTIQYAKQFLNPVIVMEDLNGIRNNFHKSKKLNKRFHPSPFRRLQTYIEYKALLEGIETKHLTKKETRNTSEECHRCGYVTQVEGRIYKCLNCGMEYDRDLNACINVAHRITSPVGWGSGEFPEPSNEGVGAKPALNEGSPHPFRGG
jgi:putative transposase